MSSLKVFQWIFISVCSFNGVLCAQSSVVLSLDGNHPGGRISKDFIGLSYETQRILPNQDGTYYFTASNKRLIALFKMLGIKSLRIGGNTADRPWVPIPSHRDIDALFSFAKAAEVKVIYTVRLREGNPDNAAETANYIMGNDKDDLACFAIGNEPNVFSKEYPVYRDQWKKYADAITAQPNCAGAMFCGPCSTPGKTAWCREFADDFGSSGQIQFIAQHSYPGGNGAKVTDQDAARKAMISSEWIWSYQKFYDSFAPYIAGKGLTYRIEETNNFYNGGAYKVSDAFASAIWGLDYLYWWADHGAIGINYHTGDSVAAGERTNPCRYAVFWSAADGYSVHPLGYAIKAFDIGCHGTMIPVRSISNPDSVEISMYATRYSDGTIYATLINRDLDPLKREAVITLESEGSFSRGDEMSLTAPQNDLSASAGITLGGAEIDDGAHWEGKWTPIKKSGDNHKWTIRISARSASIVRLSL